MSHSVISSNTSSLVKLSPRGGVSQKPAPEQLPRDEVSLGSEPSSRSLGWGGALALAGGALLLAGCNPSPPPQAQVEVQPEPAPAQPLSEQVVKTREQVLLRLHQMEGNESEAMANFRLIERNLRPQEDFGEAAGSFMRILETYGRGRTSDAQSAYSLVHSSLREGESRGQAVDLMLNLYRAEGNHSEAASNYQLIHRSLRSEGNRKESTEQFLRILNQVGRGRTSDAQSMYRTLNP